MSKEKEAKIGIIIKDAREEIGLSQRELARKAQVDNAEISRIEAGKRQKPNILVLKNIAEVLDLSLVKLMKVSGYDDIDINFGRDLDEKRSLRDYKNIIDNYQRFYYDVLADISNRRKNDFEAKSIIEMLIYDIENQQEKINKENILGKLKTTIEILNSNLSKFDSSKNQIHDPIIGFNHTKDIEKELKKNTIEVPVRNIDDILENKFIDKLIDKN